MTVKRRRKLANHPDLLALRPLVSKDVKAVRAHGVRGKSAAKRDDIVMSKKQQGNSREYLLGTKNLFKKRQRFSAAS